MRIQDGWTTAGRGPGWLGLVVALVLAATPAMAWQGRVRSVPDGDSLTVERAGRTVKVRLYGIDSPEYRQPGWREARDFTRRLVNGLTVDIEPMDRDNYGRVVALVTSGGVLVNRAADAGLLLSVTADRVIRLVPALTLTRAEAEEIATLLAPLVKAFLAEGNP